MRRYAFLAALVTVAPYLHAQQSLFQSGDGQSAIYIQHPTVAVNFGDSKASAGYVHRINLDHWSWAAEGYATANSGVVSLFSSDKPKAPEGGFDFSPILHFLGKQNATTVGPAKESWILLDGGYGRSSFYVYPTNAAPSTSTPKTNFDRFRTILAINHFRDGNKLFGLATGAERRNNLSDLKSTNLQTIVVSGTTGSIVKSQAGYYGNYKEYIAAPIYGDYLYIPRAKTTQKLQLPGLDNRLGIDLLVRADVAAPNRGAKGGIGIFFLKKDDQTVPIGGLTVTYDGTKVQVGLTTGFTAKAQ